MEIGTPDSNPKHLVNWCFWYTLVNLAFFWTGHLGLWLGRGFRFRWLSYVGTNDQASSAPSPVAWTWWARWRWAAPSWGRRRCGSSARWSSSPPWRSCRSPAKTKDTTHQNIQTTMYLRHNLTIYIERYGVYIYIYMLCTYIYIYIYTYVCIYIYIYLYIYDIWYIYTYIYIYIYIYTHTHTYAAQQFQQIDNKQKRAGRARLRPPGPLPLPQARRRLNTATRQVHRKHTQIHNTHA